MFFILTACRRFQYYIYYWLIFMTSPAILTYLGIANYELKIIAFVCSNSMSACNTVSMHLTL